MSANGWPARAAVLGTILFLAAACLYGQAGSGLRARSSQWRNREHETARRSRNNPNLRQLRNFYAAPPGGEQVAALSEDAYGTADPPPHPLIQPLPPLYGPVVGRLLRCTPGGIVKHRSPLLQDFMKLGQLIHQGDSFETRADGRAEIGFYQGLTLNLGPLSRLEVESVNAASQEVRLRLSAGEIGTTVAAPGWQFQVNSMIATVDGPGGIEFIDAGRSTDVCVVNGSATVRKAEPPAGRQTRLQAGQCANATASESLGLARNPQKLIRQISKATNVSKVPDDALVLRAKRP